MIKESKVLLRKSLFFKGRATYGSAFAGWLNFRDDNGGATVFDDHLEGYVWAENIGWIKLGSHSGGSPHTYGNTDETDWGVNNDGAGNLSGYAWSENVGWINFNPVEHNQVTIKVTINQTTGDFDGYAWAENVGWIHFQNASPTFSYKVRQYNQCLKWQCTIIGTSGDDYLPGTNGDDVICGLGGDDEIYGGNGIDRICGGSGNDFLFGGNGEDFLDGGIGNDELSGENGSDVLEGGEDDDFLFGGNGDDFLFGGNGDDSLSGDRDYDECFDPQNGTFDSSCEVQVQN